MSCPIVKVIIPSRHKREVLYSSNVYSSLFLGNQNDTNNFDVESIPEWDSGKTNYNVGDKVKISSLNKAYLCGVENTRDYPPKQIDWLETDLNEFKFTNSTPTNQSVKDYVAGENIEIVLNLNQDTNYLFIQNMENINSLKVESLNADGTVRDVLVEKDLFELQTFSCSDCCGNLSDYTQNFTMSLAGCSSYTKIKITLFVRENSIAKVGTVAVGRAYLIGNLVEAVTPQINSDSKLKIQDRDLSIKRGVVYADYSVKIRAFGTTFNFIASQLLNNVGLLCFYDLGIENKDLSSFVGMHNSFNPTLDYRTDSDLTLQIYGIPSQKGY